MKTSGFWVVLKTPIFTIDFVLLRCYFWFARLNKKISKKFNLKILRPLGRGYLFTSLSERSELLFFGSSGWGKIQNFVFGSEAKIKLASTCRRGRKYPYGLPRGYLPAAGWVGFKKFFIEFFIKIDVFLLLDICICYR